MKVTKKIITCAALAVMCVSSMALPTAYAAGDDDYDFSFFIGALKANGHDSTSRYRGCNNPKNQWKVKLSNSGEGKGTKTNFWLENYNEDNVSVTVAVKEGNKNATYKPSKRSGCKIGVYLTGENNNYNGTSYDVSGIWDEETGKYAK